MSSSSSPSAPSPAAALAQDLAGQIAAADAVGALVQAAARIDRLVEQLHDAGEPVGQIAGHLQRLHALLFDRTWRLIAPAELVARSCLFVMGSEGRGEQLLKTDQDNGLLLADDLAPPAQLPALCERFSAALADFGYPPCPGGIMLSRPAWRGAAAAFTRRCATGCCSPRRPM